jgi:hypothetical protein
MVLRQTANLGRHARAQSGRDRFAVDELRRHGEVLLRSRGVMISRP